MNDEQDHSGADAAAVDAAGQAVPADQLSHDDSFDDDAWCRDFEGHRAVHEFCGHHQISWCRSCDRQCPDCVDDPRCPDCGCHIYEEYHDWDCFYGDE